MVLGVKWWNEVDGKGMEAGWPSKSFCLTKGFNRHSGMNKSIVSLFIAITDLVPKMCYTVIEHMYIYF